MTSMRIAMIGLRGLPARAGGVERHVEELATRLVDRGHEVTVFCRPGYAPRRRRRPTAASSSRSCPPCKARGGEAFVHSGLGAFAHRRQPVRRRALPRRRARGCSRR